MKLTKVTVEYLIEEHGARNLAEMCGVERTTPYQWRRRKRLSVGAILTLSSAFPRKFVVRDGILYRRTK